MLTKRSKQIGVLAVLSTMTALVVVGGGFYWVLQQGNALSEQAQAVADYANRESTYHTLEQILTDTAIQRIELEKYTLTESDTIDFLTSMESMAQLYGVLLTTDALNVAEGKGKEVFDTLHINMTMTGSEAAVMSVLKILETLPYASRIEGMTVQYGHFKSGETGTADVRASVQLAVSILSV